MKSPMKLRSRKRSIRRRSLSPEYDLEGGAWCDPSVKNYASVIIAAAFLFQYYRNKNLTDEANKVFEYIEHFSLQNSLKAADKTLKTFKKIWTTCLDLMTKDFSSMAANFVYETGKNAIFAPGETFQNIFYGTSTIVMTIKYLYAYRAFSWAVWTLCFIMSSVLKVAYVAKNPRTLAAVAVVLSLGAAQYGGAFNLPVNP